MALFQGVFQELFIKLGKFAGTRKAPHICQGAYMERAQHGDEVIHAARGMPDSIDRMFAGCLHPQKITCFQ